MHAKANPIEGGGEARGKRGVAGVVVGGVHVLHAEARHHQALHPQREHGRWVVSRRDAKAGVRKLPDHATQPAWQAWLEQRTGRRVLEATILISFDTAISIGGASFVSR